MGSRVAGFEWKATIQAFNVFVKAGQHIQTCLISLELNFLSKQKKKYQISLPTQEILFKEVRPSTKILCYDQG